MNKTIAALALLFGVIALAHSFWLGASLERRIADGAQQTLRDREQTVIRVFVPRLNQLYDDFEIIAPATQPTTIEELLDPLLEMMENVSKD